MAFVRSKFPMYDPSTDGPVFDWILTTASHLRKRNRVEQRSNHRANHVDFIDGIREVEKAPRSTAR